MIQRKIFRFGVLAFVFLMPLLVHAQRGEKIQTIVIDAGHGGKDSGALGKVSMEKTLNLAVALKLGNYIKENLPDVKVVYTRDKDVFVELSERAAIANRNNADVFISIHCNSTEGTTTVNGAETFVMGESKNEANLKVAKKENAAILLEDNTDAYDHFDPNSTEAYIIFSLTQGLYQNQSLKLADKVQKQFADKAGRHNRGVQQAGFLVLWKTSMPSILVELGFINNVKEEQFLNSERGQTQMALALYQAFAEFKQEYEAENQLAINQEEKKPEVKPEAKPEAKPEVKPEAKSEAKPEAKPAEKVEQPSSANEEKEIYFSVQFASVSKNVSTKDPTFRKIKGVRKYKSKGMYCYSSGKFPTKAAAEKRKKELQDMGYADAFIVAFIDHKRVSVSQAEAALKKK
jgi:N-acetylmuramoyl-L-alanine amidase